MGVGAAGPAAGRAGSTERAGVLPARRGDRALSGRRRAAGGGRDPPGRRRRAAAAVRRHGGPVPARGVRRGVLRRREIAAYAVISGSWPRMVDATDPAERVVSGRGTACGHDRAAGGVRVPVRGSLGGVDLPAGRWSTYWRGIT